MAAPVPITTQAIASILDVACYQISIAPITHEVVLNGPLDVEKVESHLYENNEDYDGALDGLIRSLTWDSVILPGIEKLVIINNSDPEYTYTRETPNGVTVRAFVESVVKVRMPAKELFCILRLASSEPTCQTYKVGFHHGVY